MHACCRANETSLLVQLKNMMEKGRIFATLIFLVSLVLTLFAALKVSRRYSSSCVTAKLSLTQVLSYSCTASS